MNLPGTWPNIKEALNEAEKELRDLGSNDLGKNLADIHRMVSEFLHNSRDTVESVVRMRTPPQFRPGLDRYDGMFWVEAWFRLLDRLANQPGFQLKKDLDYDLVCRAFEIVTYGYGSRDGIPAYLLSNLYRLQEDMDTDNPLHEEDLDNWSYELNPVLIQPVQANTEVVPPAVVDLLPDLVHGGFLLGVWRELIEEFECQHGAERSHVLDDIYAGFELREMTDDATTNAYDCARGILNIYQRYYNGGVGMLDHAKTAIGYLMSSYNVWVSGPAVPIRAYTEWQHRLWMGLLYTELFLNQEKLSGPYATEWEQLVSYWIYYDDAPAEARTGAVAALWDQLYDDWDLDHILEFLGGAGLNLDTDLVSPLFIDRLPAFYINSVHANMGSQIADESDGFDERQE